MTISSPFFFCQNKALQRCLVGLEMWAMQNSSRAFAYEFICFGVKQAWACLFAGLMVFLIIATYFFYPQNALLARYDFIFISAVVIQFLMIFFRLETIDEAKVIFIFHAAGTMMEIFKTSYGSWAYPEASIFHIAGVPLFSGFMYASIGSYIARSFHIFDFKYKNHPPVWTIFVLGAAVYINFFSHHFVYDCRFILFVATGLLFCRTWIYFRIGKEYRRMPILLALVLSTFFVWVAENVGTLTKTWLYPNQHVAWAIVSFGKYGSWFLLMVVSYALICLVNKPEELND